MSDNISGRRWWLWICYIIGIICLIHDFSWVQHPDSSDFSNGSFHQVMMTGSDVS